MISYLTQLKLPVDHLVRKLCREEHLESLARHPVVTLRLVKDPTLQRVARQYITKLLNFRELYGYLYFLNTKRLRKPLTIDYKSEGFAEPLVDEALQELAREFSTDPLFQDITRVELLYFCILLVRPSLSWLAIEAQLQCVPCHAHLLMSPDRPYSWEIKT